MKATGVVRRIDDLGRIVIPKEIRRTLKINDGDNVEIYVSDDSIVLKKYCFLNSSFLLAQKLTDSFYNIYHKIILITDNEKIVAGSKKYLNKTLSTTIVDIINNRSEIEKNICITNDNDSVNVYLYPIISSSDALGSVILISDDISAIDKSIIKLMSAILVKNVEE